MTGKGGLPLVCGMLNQMLKDGDGSACAGDAMRHGANYIEFTVLDPTPPVQPNLSTRDDEAVDEHAWAPVELMFHSDNFNHERSPHRFPAAKNSVRAGDTIVLQGTWEQNSHASSKEQLCRVRVAEWTRLDIESAAVETAVERLQREGQRRTGKAAMAGWVMCPICATQRLDFISTWTAFVGSSREVF